MTVREYWELFRSSWLLLFSTTLVGLVSALALSTVATPQYQAEAQLFVSVQSADEISGAYTGGLYVQQRIKSYVTLVDTPGVLEPVIDELGLDVDYLELGDSVSAQNPTSTVLLDVLVTDTDPERAAAVADAAARSLAEEIERLETTESEAKPVQVDLIRPAEVPTDAVLPRTRLNVALGALLGLLAGAGVAILRSLLDTSVKSASTLQQATDSIVLGEVAYDSETARRALVTLKGSPFAEAYRQIRTNLQYVDVDNPPRRVVVTSSVPHEGKSTIAANLAIALAQGGARVLLVEADLRRPRIGEYFGVDSSVGLTDVLVGRAPLGDAIVSWHRGLLDFLPSGPIPPNPSELLGSRQLSDLLNVVSKRYDLLILDAPPLLPVTDAAILTAATDGAILVARHGSTRREQVHQAAAALHKVNARLIGTVLNFVPDSRRARGYGYGYPARARDAAQHQRLGHEADGDSPTRSSRLAEPHP